MRFSPQLSSIRHCRLPGPEPQLGFHGWKLTERRNAAGALRKPPVVFRTWVLLCIIRVVVRVSSLRRTEGHFQLSYSHTDTAVVEHWRCITWRYCRAPFSPRHCSCSESTPGRFAATECNCFRQVHEYPRSAECSSCRYPEKGFVKMK